MHRKDSKQMKTKDDFTKNFQFNPQHLNRIQKAFLRPVENN